MAADASLNPHTEGGCTVCLGTLTIDGQSVTRNAAYYIIAHSSKFARPGSKRISSNTTMGIQNVAYKAKDGRKLLFTINTGEKPEEFRVLFNGRVFEDKLNAEKCSNLLLVKKGCDCSPFLKF